MKKKKQINIPVIAALVGIAVLLAITAANYTGLLVGTNPPEVTCKISVGATNIFYSPDVSKPNEISMEIKFVNSGLAKGDISYRLYDSLSGEYKLKGSVPATTITKDNKILLTGGGKHELDMTITYTDKNTGKLVEKKCNQPLTVNLLLKTT